MTWSRHHSLLPPSSSLNGPEPNEHTAYYTRYHCVYKDYAVHEAKTHTNDGRYILHEFMRCIECVLVSVCLYEYAFRDNVSAVDTAAAAAILYPLCV